MSCFIFGHYPSKGYANSVPYALAKGGTTDGIGTQHWRLYTECGRCGKEYHALNVHGPLDSHRKTKEQLEREWMREQRVDGL